MATYGPYAGSKFALEAVSDALRREVERLGVKVIVVEPGAVTTEMLGRVAVAGERIARPARQNPLNDAHAALDAAVLAARGFSPKTDLPAQSLELNLTGVVEFHLADTPGGERLLHRARISSKLIVAASISAPMNCWGVVPNSRALSDAAL